MLPLCHPPGRRSLSPACPFVKLNSFAKSAGILFCCGPSGPLFSETVRVWLLSKVIAVTLSTLVAGSDRSGHSGSILDKAALPLHSSLAYTASATNSQRRLGFRTSPLTSISVFKRRQPESERFGSRTRLGSRTGPVASAERKTLRPSPGLWVPRFPNLSDLERSSGTFENRGIRKPRHRCIVKNQQIFMLRKTTEILQMCNEKNNFSKS